MSNNTRATVRNWAEVDPRVVRTTQALGRALVDLIQERDFDGIVVQNILDRAGVARSTFYAHYRNKEDVLHSSYERVFTVFEQSFDTPSSTGARLFPVTEFLNHVSEARGVVDALRISGRLGELWDLGAGYAARIIERRMEASTDVTPEIPRSLVARMLAGALFEGIKWWYDHPSVSTPAQIDAAFHEMARGALRRARRL
jgi:AcrR family transcriptional regulator